LPVLLEELAADPRLRRLAAVLSKGVNASLSQAERKS
jgi:hypothetical protein